MSAVTADRATAQHTRVCRITGMWIEGCSSGPCVDQHATDQSAAGRRTRAAVSRVVESIARALVSGRCPTQARRGDTEFGGDRRVDYTMFRESHRSDVRGHRQRGHSQLPGVRPSARARARRDHDRRREYPSAHRCAMCGDRGSRPRTATRFQRVAGFCARRECGECSAGYHSARHHRRRFSTPLECWAARADACPRRSGAYRHDRSATSRRYNLAHRWGRPADPRHHLRTREF